MARFQPGHVGMGGRPPGSPNKVGAQARLYCQKILAGLNIDKLIHDLFLNPDGSYKPLTEVSSRVLLRLMEYGWGAPRQEIAVEMNLRDSIAQARQRVLDGEYAEPSRALPENAAR